LSALPLPGKARTPPPSFLGRASLRSPTRCAGSRGGRLRRLERPPAKTPEATLPDKPRHHILTVLVENKAGVLARVSSLFARRGFNIYSLAVAPTDDEKFSRITIVVDVESSPLEQVTKQLFKLINVVKISELDPADAVEREMMMITVNAEPGTRGQVIELVDVFQGRIVDVGHDQLTVELAGPPSKLDDFEDLMRAFGIAALQRTGRVALPKLERTATRLRSLGKVG
jgi:acetolactate synthase-1/3 small subunit